MQEYLITATSFIKSHHSLTLQIKGICQPKMYIIWTPQSQVENVPRTLCFCQEIRRNNPEICLPSRIMKGQGCLINLQMPRQFIVFFSCFCCSYRKVLENIFSGLYEHKLQFNMSRPAVHEIMIISQLTYAQKHKDLFMPS